jgi:hypothetical protein
MQRPQSNSTEITTAAIDGRVERKFLVSDQVAFALREAVSRHLAIDAHTPPRSPRGYAVYTLYYDTPALELYRHTCEGRDGRLKLRVRFYDQDAQGPAFVEVKEKRDSLVFKRRFEANKPFVEAMLRDPQCDQLNHALSNGARGSALEEFCRRRHELGALPKLLIVYEREAYESASEPRVRVTFDRRIRTNSILRAPALLVPPYGTNVGGLNVLVEFKHPGETPAWLADLEQQFHLRQASFSKFAECIDALQMYGPQPLVRRPRRKPKLAPASDNVS